MRKNVLISIIVFCLFLIGCAAIGPMMSRVEQPSYDVMNTDNNIQIRQYKPMIVAEVIKQGERKKAINDGFRALADYIFGNNTSKNEIAMTAPVQQTVDASSVKIPMTAPVQQQAENGSWVIRFVMPSDYTRDTLPQPNNSDINIREIPAKNYAVIQFSGLASQNNIDKHESELLDYIKTKDLKTKGVATYAFYNPPWTLPFLRRNEIMIEIVD